jgi:hypothetical protein
MRPAMGYFDVRNDRLHAVQHVAANGRTAEFGRRRANSDEAERLMAGAVHQACGSRRPATTIRALIVTQSAVSARAVRNHQRPAARRDARCKFAAGPSPYRGAIFDLLAVCTWAASRPRNGRAHNMSGAVEAKRAPMIALRHARP